MKCINCGADFPANVNFGIEDNKLCPECFKKIACDHGYNANESIKDSTPVIEKRSYSFTYIVAGIGLILIWLFIRSQTNNGIEEAVPTPGDTVFLSHENHSRIWISKTEKDYQELSKLATANDISGIKEMALEGKCFLVDDSTKAILIGMGSFFGPIYEIRIKAGPRFDQKGFVVKSATHKY